MTDSYGCWCLAVAAWREKKVRSGEYRPINETERRWAAEGPREARKLDTVNRETKHGYDLRI